MSKGKTFFLYLSSSILGGEKGEKRENWKLFFVSLVVLLKTAIVSLGRRTIVREEKLSISFGELISIQLLSR